MDSTLTGLVAFPHPHRQKPLSGRNSGPAASRTIEPYETASTGGKVEHDCGKVSVGENANPKAKVKCTCGNMIHPSSLERHLRTHKFHNPIGKFVCDRCQVHFTRKESLKRHVEQATCRKARCAVDMDADHSLPPARSSTKRKRENSGCNNKVPVTPETMLHKGDHGVPKVSRARPSTSSRVVDRSNPVASAQFDDDEEEDDNDDDDYDAYDDDAEEEDKDNDDYDTYDDDDDCDAHNDDDVGEDGYESEEDEDDLDNDVAKPPSWSIEVTELLPVVDMSINPALDDFLLEYGINEDDEPFDPLYFSTSDVALMSNSYYRNDTHIHF